MDFGQLSLRQRERGLVLGGTGSGKSTLAEHLITDFLARYKAGQVLVLDSKPRFRAVLRADGRRADRLYRGWDHGARLPGSVRVDTKEDLDLAAGTGHRLFIGQNDQDSVAQLTVLAGHFYRTMRAKTPRLLVVDEMGDFYTQPGGQQLRGTEGSILRTIRAGREKGGGALMCSQRAKGIPVQALSETTKVWLFRMDFTEDLSRLRECGFPPEIRDTPWPDHHFAYWTRQARHRTYGPYRLRLPD